MIKPEIIVGKDPAAVADLLVSHFRKLVQENHAAGTCLHVAVSGGSTPRLFFERLGSDHQEDIPWAIIQFYWVDERCVAPDDKDSNYGMVREALFRKIAIPEANIHRIRGEEDPEAECTRYASEISAHVPRQNGRTIFDLVILGIGEDGHTASIFPDQMALLQSAKVCEVSLHPQTGQTRITLTGPVINSAKQVFFIATGKNKSRILRSVINERKRFYPASHIAPASGGLTWFLDEDSSRGIRV